VNIATTTSRKARSSAAEADRRDRWRAHEQLDTADRRLPQEKSRRNGLLTKTRLREKLAKLERSERLAAIEKALLASPDSRYR